MKRCRFMSWVLAAMAMSLAVVITPMSVKANTTPPASPVKLIFIHHSTGGNWLADETPDNPSGGLGMALMNNNYFVSATNYDWGPDGIGSNTDIIQWPDWFNDSAVMNAVYNEFGQNLYDTDDWRYFGNWTRMAADPGGENEIVMFKSCFPNSDLYGGPEDAAYAEPNDYEYSVSNAKAVYNNLLSYFQTRQDKLFIVITAPPMSLRGYEINDPSTSAAERAANARAFNDWLVNDWLDGYAYNNVAVFDYYNVLTSNGGDIHTNDAGQETGNHHRWYGGQVTHTQTLDNNYSAYPSFVGDDWADDHPTSAGHRKATAEFVPLLNHYYNRWKTGATMAEVQITGLDYDITGTTSAGSQVTFTADATGAETIYYRFDLIPNYGTDDYDPFEGYTTLRDFSTGNTLTHTFTEQGGYVLIVYASASQGFSSGVVPIVGGSVFIGPGHMVHMNNLAWSGDGTASVGDTIAFTALGVSDNSSDDLYYRFDLVPAYGTAGYDPYNNYTTIQDFSTNRTCNHLFTSPGSYIVVVYVNNSPMLPVAMAPIIGGSITVK